MKKPTMTPAEVLAVLDRIASFHHPIDRIEVLKSRAAVAALVAERDALSEAAQAVIARWDSPMWRHTEHTGALIAKLRAALAGASNG